MKVAAHLESTRLFDSANLRRLEAGTSDQSLDFIASTVVTGREKSTAGTGDRLLEASRDRPTWFQTPSPNAPPPATTGNDLA